MDEIILKADNKSSAIKQIISITPGATDTRSLEKANIRTIRELSAGCDPACPSMYAIVNNSDEEFTIELDYTPSKTYDETNDPDEKLIVHYYPNFRVLGDNTDFSEFSDYNEADMSKGKWKLPSDWHKLIIDGALANMFPEKREAFELECVRKSNSQAVNANFKLSSFLGVSGKSHGRRYR